MASIARKVETGGGIGKTILDFYGKDWGHRDPPVVKLKGLSIRGKVESWRRRCDKNLPFSGGS